VTAEALGPAREAITRAALPRRGRHLDFAAARSDESGIAAVGFPLLGLDHERLTYRYAGRDFRLTDVHGKVIREVVA
jgi:hypothetical protein